MSRRARPPLPYGLIASLILIMAVGRPAPAAAAAQQTTGTVAGAVQDAQGAVVPGVTLELVNDATGTPLSLASDTTGAFTFNYVPPGTYTLHARLDGFAPVAVRGLLVSVTRTTRVDVKLEAGGVTDSVDVTATRQTVDTVSAQVSTQITRKEIESLPMFNRQVLAFAELAPGVDMDFSPTTGGTGQTVNIQGAGAAVNGNRSGRNGFYLDGVDNTAAFRNSALNFPNPDAVQEVQVATSNTSAEFGRQPGGAFNVITRSGTNEFRGSGSYFFRVSALNANTWANARDDRPKPDDRQKIGSGAFGGPIVRDRTFFFTTGMAFRTNDVGEQTNTRFPTEAMRRGDFSGVPVQLLDPDTKQPLPGNQIPSRLIDPVAVNLAALMPTVATYNDRYFWQFEAPTRNDEFLLKIDHRFSAAHALQASGYTTWGKSTYPNQSGRPSAENNIPAWGPETDLGRQVTSAVRHTWVVTNRFVMENRVSVASMNANRTNANIGRNLGDFGAQHYPVSQEGAQKYLPHLTIANGPNARNGFLSEFNQRNVQIVSSASWAASRHNLKAGIEVQRQNVRQYDDTERMYFLFDGRYAAGLTAAPAAANQFAFAFADFMMGRISPAATYSASGILDYDVANWNLFGYVQDEWRVSSRLTITPGLRYEIYYTPREKDDKQVAFELGHQSTRFPNAPQNLAFAGDAGLDGGFFKPDRNNIAPRLGVAYDVLGDGRFAIRGGVGMYYSYTPSQVFIWTAENNPWRPEVFGSGGRLSDPWLTSQNPTYAAPPTPMTGANVANFNWVPPYTATGFADSFATPFSVQWNIAAERELMRGLSVTAGYVGNRGHRFTQVLPINYAVYAPGATDAAGNINARRPIANFANVYEIDSAAKLWYDALQTSATVRRGAVLVRGSYVLAKGWDTASADPTSQSGQVANPLDLEGERGQNQRRHTFRVFFSYELPFLRGGDPSIASALVGGWQLAGTVRARSGAPLNVTLGTDWNFDGVTGDRPDQVSEIAYPRTLAPDGSYRWFDTAAFAQPGGGTNHDTFGTLPRNAVVGPGDWTADLSLLKNFRLGGERNVQVRIEAYNVLNHPVLGTPVVNFANADFGRITSRSGNRRVQLGARFSF